LPHGVAGHDGACPNTPRPQQLQHTVAQGSQRARSARHHHAQLPQLACRPHRWRRAIGTRRRRPCRPTDVSILISPVRISEA